MPLSLELRVRSQGLCTLLGSAWRLQRQRIENRHSRWRCWLIGLISTSAREPARDKEQAYDPAVLPMPGRLNVLGSWCCVCAVTSKRASHDSTVSLSVVGAPCGSNVRSTSVKSSATPCSLGRIRMFDKIPATCTYSGRIPIQSRGALRKFHSNLASIRALSMPGQCMGFYAPRSGRTMSSAVIFRICRKFSLRYATRRPRARFFHEVRVVEVSASPAEAHHYKLDPAKSSMQRRCRSALMPKTASSKMLPKKASLASPTLPQLLSGVR